jgi:hypothetical protein
VVNEAPPPAKSTIDFNVGYVVETTSLLEDFVQPLEALILETAVQGALQCGDGGPLFGPNGNPLQILMFTSMTGDDCDPQVEGSTCIVLETKFTLLVKENLNPDLGAFLGYVDLQKNMDNGTFVASIPQLDRIEYLKPLPLLPPITGPAPASVSGESSQVSVSSWTIGAVVAMCTFSQSGGIESSLLLDHLTQTFSFNICTSQALAVRSLSPPGRAIAALGTSDTCSSSKRCRRRRRRPLSPTRRSNPSEQPIGATRSVGGLFR